MTYHFVQFIIGLSYSFPVITVDNKYQTLRAKTTDAQTDDKYSEVNIIVQSQSQHLDTNQNWLLVTSIGVTTMLSKD